MARLTIDLSGAGGLAPNFAGDLNDTSAKPHLRYQGGNSQVADGIFDPLRLYGYMSPANNTFADLTGTITSPFISRTYSPTADVLYLAQNGTKLSTVSGLDGTAITSTTILDGTSTFKDLEMYEVNGDPAVFYTYKYLDTSISTVTNTELGFTMVDSNKGVFQLSSTIYESLPLDDTADQPITAATNNQKLSQSFLSGEMNFLTNLKVSGIRLRLKMPYIGTSQVWTLRAGIQTNTAGSPSGTYVTGASATVDPSTLAVGEYAYVYFTFATPVTLTAQTTYHIVLEPTVFGDLGANEGIYWLSSYNANSLYSSGVAKKYNGTAWSAVSASAESMDFALVLNQITHIGQTSGTETVDTGYVLTGATGNGYTAGATSLSFTQVTTSVPNPCIVVGIFVANITDVVTGVTCDGVAMTLQRKQATVGFEYIYTITGVSAGTHTILISLSSSKKIIGVSGAYYHVDQTTPFSTLSTTNDTGGAHTTYTTNAAGGRIGALALAVSHVDILDADEVTGDGTTTVRRSNNATDKSLALLDADTHIATTLNANYSMTFNALTASVPDAAKFYTMLGSLNPAATSSTVNIPATTDSTDGTGFLKKADNGFLYWFVNNAVHKFDGGFTGGTTGILTPEVLLFPRYLSCVDAVDTQSRMYIAVQSSTTSEGNRTFPADVLGLYEWDRQSVNVSVNNFIPAYGAREIKKVFVNADGELRAITIGSDRRTEVRGVSQGRLVVLRTLGLSAYPVYRDGVDFISNMATWLGADGIVYALGKPQGGATENLYKIGTINGEVSGTLTSGILSTGHSSAGASLPGVFISWADNANTLTKWYPHGTGTINSVAQKGQQGDVYSLVTHLPYLATVQHILITCVPNGVADDTTTVATLKFYKNMNSTPFMTKTVQSKDLVKGYLSYEINKSFINSLQIEVEYPTGLTLGANDFLPAFAVLDYLPPKITGPK